MSKADKLLARFRQNPRNVRPEELENVLLRLGFTKRAGKGSHRVYTQGRFILTVPYRKPFLRQRYVKEALAAIDALAIDDATEE